MPITETTFDETALPAPRARSGGMRCSYPNKSRRHLTIQITDKSLELIERSRLAQMQKNWRGMSRLPSLGDMVDGLTQQFIAKLVLPTPTGQSAAAKRSRRK